MSALVEAIANAEGEIEELKTKEAREVARLKHEIRALHQNHRARLSKLHGELSECYDRERKLRTRLERASRDIVNVCNVADALTKVLEVAGISLTGAPEGSELEVACREAERCARVGLAAFESRATA